VREKLYAHLKQALIDGLQLIKNLEEESGEKKWLLWMFKDHKNYPSMSILNDWMPSFTLSDYGKKDYGRVLTEENRYLKLCSWLDYHNFVLSTPELAKYYEIGEHSPNWRNKPTVIEAWNSIYTYFFLGNFVDGYVHRYSLEFVEENFNNLFEKYDNSIFLNPSPIDIFIPIIFTVFDFEQFELAPGVLIMKMDTNVQLSRNIRTSFTGPGHTTVIGAATHALVLKNWTIPNNTSEARSHSLHDISNFKNIIETVNQFFAALRISIPGLETGFVQIITRPVNWESNFNADIMETFVVSERNYPDYFEKYEWLQMPAHVTEADADRVKRSLNAILNSPYLELACKRLNKACLNSREDDAIIDITIALESLLTSDSRSEINYRLATRAALLSKTENFKEHTAEEIFQLCKKIYDFRSSVVHGDKKRQLKTRVIKMSEDKEIEAIELGIEFLKHTIWQLIKNGQIKKAEDIDKLLF
jgi:hypothetical protein